MINKIQLKQLIKEEISKFLSEQDEELPTVKSSEEDVKSTAKMDVQPPQRQGENYLLPLVKALTKKAAKIQLPAGSEITVNVAAEITKHAMTGDKQITLTVSPSMEARKTGSRMTGLGMPLYSGETFIVKNLTNGKVSVSTGGAGMAKLIATGLNVDPNAIWSAITNYIIKY